MGDAQAKIVTAEMQRSHSGQIRRPARAVVSLDRIKEEAAGVAPDGLACRSVLADRRGRSDEEISDRRASPPIGPCPIGPSARP